jgi:hypothetical protein
MFLSIEVTAAAAAAAVEVGNARLLDDFDWTTFLTGTAVVVAGFPVSFLSLVDMAAVIGPTLARRLGVELGFWTMVAVVMHGRHQPIPIELVFDERRMEEG